MNQSKYNDPQSRSNRYARPSSRTLKCDKLDPDEFFNCADINGKLYRLYNLFEDIEASEAFKKQQPKQIKRLDTGTAKPLQSRISQKDAKRPRGRPKKNAIINPVYPQKNAMEMGEERESPKTISKTVSPKSKLDYVEDMELGAAFRKQQLPSSRRSLGVAAPRRPGRPPKGSKNCSTGSSVVDWRKLDEPSVVIRRSARIQAAKLRKQQSLEGSLQKDQEKANSGMVVDWEKLDKPERVQEPPIVLRRSARIQAAKLKKEALEASLRNQNQNQEKPSSRKVSQPRIARKQVCRSCPNCNSNTFLRPRPITYFECAEINGKLYRLNDIWEDVQLGAAFRRKQKKAQPQRRGTLRVRRGS